MADSANQTTSTHSVGDLAAELQKIKRAKIWWWQRDDVLKARMSTTVMAGILLSIVLTIYLALLLTNHLTLREIQTVVILLLLLVGLFFIHSIARLIIAAIRPAHDSSRSGSPSELDIENQTATTVNVTFFRGPGGYAIPAAPIPIALPDIDKAPEAVTTLPPPAYGLWRSSVRVNPDQFYWIRRDSDTSPPESTPAELDAGTPPPPASPVPNVASVPTAYRPPSYHSEDGVEYVLGGPRVAGTTALAASNAARESLAQPQSVVDGGSANMRSVEGGNTRGEDESSVVGEQWPLGPGRVG